MQEYINVDQRIHQLSQIVAKANRTYVAKKSDDSHTNLYYNPVSEKLKGRWIGTNEGNIMLALDLTAYQFEIINNSHQVLHEIPVDGKTTARLESETEHVLKSLGLDTTGFKAELHFEINNYGFKEDAFTNLSETGLHQWKKFRKLANEEALHLLGYLQSESEIRIWPHHFDTGVYTEVNDNIGIGFGLAMADSMEASPYFYLSGYALDNKKIKFDQVPKLRAGRWEIGEYWKGAVLSLSGLKSLEENELSEAIIQFIKGGCKLYLYQ